MNLIVKEGTTTLQTYHAYDGPIPLKGDHITIDNGGQNDVHLVINRHMNLDDHEVILQVTDLYTGDE